jgi:GSH-dependent disulfide-bond oxidoreductase
VPVPIEVFFWTTPNGWKVTIALEKMGLPYVIRSVGKVEQFKPEFLATSPNNRIPSIIDPDGAGAAPISVFESGAILQYLGRKTGQFYARNERDRMEVDEWPLWQMAGVGPMLGQASHFWIYAPSLVDDPVKIEYADRRYSNEVNRLLGALDRQVAEGAFVTGDYWIADMALYPWVAQAGYLGRDMTAFPLVGAWFDRVASRPAVQNNMAMGKEPRRRPPAPGSDEACELAGAQFGQTASSVAEARAQQV